MPDTPVTPRRVAAGGAGAAAVAIMAVCGPLISKHEGLVLASYRDPRGIWTDCRGHTGPEVKAGQVFTLAQCNQTFDADQLRIIVSIGDCTTVDAPIASFAAFTSFAFNAGPGTYCRNFAPLVNAGRLKDACEKLPLYVYANHVRLKGLVARRAEELALCLQGVAAQSSPP